MTITLHDLELVASDYKYAIDKQNECSDFAQVLFWQREAQRLYEKLTMLTDLLKWQVLNGAKPTIEVQSTESVQVTINVSNNT